ncbi:ribosomal large subunit assembly [Homalodisca vitripennis]|nr:ribosomal large subunit assembly [Homalodisca vitripennis]
MADDLRSQDIRNVLEEQMSDVSDSDISADNFPDDYNSNPGAGHSLQRLPGRQERLCIVCGHTKKGEDHDYSVQDAILVFIESVSINWIIFGDQSIKGGRESMIVVVPKSEWKGFFHEIQQLVAVMLSPSRRVETVAALLCEFVTGNSEKDHHQAVSQTQLCRTSLLRSAESLVKHYGTWYPDVVVPVVSAISQMSHGLSLMIGAARCHSTSRKVDVEPLLKSFVRFPVPDCCAAMELVDICTSTQTLDLIHETVKAKVKEGETPNNETFRLAKCSLQELRNVVSVRGRLDGKDDWAIICRILDCMVVAWQRQEQARAQKEQEENNYFINK